jgi:hypothetical protein
LRSRRKGNFGLALAVRLAAVRWVTGAGKMNKKIFDTELHMGGSSYTHSELEADPALAAIVWAQRRAVWDCEVFRPKAQRTGTQDSNKPKLEVRT